MTTFIIALFIGSVIGLFIGEALRYFKIVGRND